MTIDEVLGPVFSELRALGDPAMAEPMVAYMKGQFPFLGVTAPDRRRVIKPVLKWAKTIDAEQLVALANRCWAEDEREFQYVGVDSLRAGAENLRAADLPSIRTLVETKSWWDTVDLLAAWVVGPLVAAEPDLSTEIDEWIDDPDIWVARTAILHQLGYKDATDQERLFSYVEKRAADKEFFIRKALGWALRQHARTNPDAVGQFVHEHQDQLSGLTKREALKHIG